MYTVGGRRILVLLLLGDAGVMLDFGVAGVPFCCEPERCECGGSELGDSSASTVSWGSSGGACCGRDATVG